MLEKGLSLLLDESLVESMIRWWAILLPPVATIAGLIRGILSGRLKQNSIRGLAIGLFGPLTLLLWIAYNRIIETYGLDSVRNLLLNLALFLASGIGLGLLYRLVFRLTENQRS
jgi:hypothetical protein